MVLYCNFRSLPFLVFIGFLIKAARSLIYSYPPECSQAEWFSTLETQNLGERIQPVHLSDLSAAKALHEVLSAGARELEFCPSVVSLLRDSRPLLGELL